MLLKKKVVASKAKNSFSQSFKNPSLTKKNLTSFIKQTNVDVRSSSSFSQSQNGMSQDSEKKSLQRTRSARSNLSVNVNVSLDAVQASPACSFSTLSSQQLNQKECKKAYLQFVHENKKYDHVSEIISPKENHNELSNKEVDLDESNKSLFSEDLESEQVKELTFSNGSQRIRKSKKNEENSKAKTTLKNNLANEDSDGPSLSQDFLNDPQIKKIYKEFIKTKLSQDENKSSSKRGQKKNMGESKEKIKNKSKKPKPSKISLLSKNVETTNINDAEDTIKKKEVQKPGKFVRKESAKVKRKITSEYLKDTKKDRKTFSKPVKPSFPKTLSKRTWSDVSDGYRDKLISDLDMRDVGLYVFCDRCDKTRYLPHVKDPLDLPPKWYCELNPDKRYNKCTDPDVELSAKEDDMMIMNLYNAGSIVWAKMDGYPWWPAMVDDDPDTEDYFWLEGDSNVPTWYHVTFFDVEVSRAWMRPSQLCPFRNTNNINASFPNVKKYKHRLEVAYKAAQAASSLELLDRLKQYSFLVRYNKPIRKPKNIPEVKVVKPKKTRDKVLKKKRLFQICSSESENFNHNETKKTSDCAEIMCTAQCLDDMDIESDILGKFGEYDGASECCELQLFDNL